MLTRAYISYFRIGNRNYLTRTFQDVGHHRRTKAGARPREVAFSKDSSSEQTVGKYSITFKDDPLLISEGQSVVAFFLASHAISAIRSAGGRIGVGCNNGDVLQLRALWLV